MFLVLSQIGYATETATILLLHVQFLILTMAHLCTFATQQELRLVVVWFQLGVHMLTEMNQNLG